MKHNAFIRPTRSEKRTPLYEQALSGTLSEIELTPFYPRKRGKNPDATHWPDELFGYLEPIIYRLNIGKTIEPNSREHKSLKELLLKAEQ